MYECVMFGYFFFFFTRKTAYEVRISDWSSDVCSSDLIFDCGREDIRAARDDQVLESVADEQKAIIVHMPDIARLDPAIDDCLRGEFGIVPIAEHDPVMPHDDFAGHTARRSEERRVGNECGRTCRSRCAPYH